MPSSEAFATETSENEKSEHPQIKQITQIPCEGEVRQGRTNHLSLVTNHVFVLVGAA